MWNTNLLYANKNLETLESVVNTKLREVCQWLNANKLTLNIKKSNFVIFRPLHKLKENDHVDLPMIIDRLPIETNLSYNLL